MGSVGKSLFGSSNEATQSSRSNSKTNTTSSTNPFNGDMATNYSDYLNSAKNNYNSAATTLNNKINAGETAADTSKLDSVWSKYNNLDNSNLEKLNSQSFNPSDNADWTAAQDTIDANARKNWGSTINQVNQNIIGSGMANGSGHQSAAYNASSKLNSQLASDRATRWQDQYNKNIDNSQEANKQLSDFYNNLSNIGVDYAKLSQQDFATLLSAYQTANNALNSYGNAISMGSNPTTTSNSETNKTATGTATREDTPSVWSQLMAVGTAASGGGAGF